MKKPGHLLRQPLPTGTGDSLEKYLAKLPLDDFSKLVLTGALRVVGDVENPIRLNLFASAIRELFGHTLHRLAPDDEVKACIWFRLEKD